MRMTTSSLALLVLRYRFALGILRSCDVPKDQSLLLATAYCSIARNPLLVAALAGSTSMPPQLAPAVDGVWSRPRGLMPSKNRLENS